MENKIIKFIEETAKAIASGVAALAAYLVGVMGAEDGLGDVSVVQWLGAVVFLAGTYGLTYAVPNRPRPEAKRRRVTGQ